VALWKQLLLCCTCRLEAQLEEALAQRAIHKPAIDIDTPADKTLKLLDKIMRGHDVSIRSCWSVPACSDSKDMPGLAVNEQFSLQA